MEYIRRIQDFEQVKILADNRRLTILRLLMAAPMTLSQLGLELGEHPARVRHHLKLLEGAGLIEMVDTRVVRGFVEKYYRARARAFLLQEIILPPSAENSIHILGSHDLALEVVAERLRKHVRHPLELTVLPIGSLEGLIALRQGAAHLAGCHLFDPETGEFNLSYIRHIFPDRDMVLVTVAHRAQGLLVAEGNPKGIRSLEDLARPEVCMINRNRGSGTRLWLDRHLAQLSIPPESLNGYRREARTHTAVAEAIRQGRADVGLGLQAAACSCGLDFIPIFEERFDLALTSDQLDDRRLFPLLDYLQSRAFRKLAAGLEGYNSVHSGDQLTP